MSDSIEDELLVAADNYISALIDSLSLAAAEAYAAGAFHAMGQMRVGLSWSVVQKDALEFMKSYRKRLVEDGILEVTDIVFDEVGKPVGHSTKEIKWLNGKPADMRNDLVSIIRKGIAEGKPTGVRVSKSGTYPKGSIAEELNEYFDAYKSQASTIARTETARCYYSGERERYARAGVQYVQYMGAPDACDVCQEYIGKVFVLGSEPPLPLHPNCRCDYRPYFPEDGEIIENTDGNNL